MDALIGKSLRRSRWNVEGRRTMWRMSRIETLAFIAAVIVAVAVMLLAQSLTGSGAARRSIGASGRATVQICHTGWKCAVVPPTVIIRAITETYDFRFWP
jgi:hypothetical protein